LIGRESGEAFRFIRGQDARIGQRIINGADAYVAEATREEDPGLVDLAVLGLAPALELDSMCAPTVTPMSSRAAVKWISALLENPSVLRSLPSSPSLSWPYRRR
jgi:hypothetical protein